MKTGSQRRGSVLSGLVMLLVFAAVAGGLGYYYFQPSNTDFAKDLIIQKVERGPFDHIVLEQGEIESSKNTEILCEVKSRSGGSGGVSILWVVDEGTTVKKGDKLVELDSSQLEQERKQQRIIVGNAEAAVITAEATLKQAEIARQEYMEGTFMTEEKAIESEMAVAEQDLRKAQLALDSSHRLVAKGLIKSLQLEADQFAVANAENQLAAAKGRLRVLQELTREKMLVQFDSDIAAARANLEAVRGTLDEEREKMAEIEEQIAACVMTAPNDGVVVHANQYSSRGGNAEFVVEAGATVRERQAIIRLPDPTKMQVAAKINESRVTLVREGMPVKIRVDAIAGMELLGRVSKVDRYAAPGSFWSQSTKEYGTTIQIIDPPPTIRTGMTAEARIFVQQLPDALQVPIQGVYQYGKKTYALVIKGGKTFETREVLVGATNEKMATIEDGLSESDFVVLNLRQHLHLVDLPELSKEDTSELSEMGSDAADTPPEGGRREEGRREDGPSEDGPRDQPADDSRRNGPLVDGRPGDGPPVGGSPGGDTTPLDGPSADSQRAGDAAGESARS